MNTLDERDNNLGAVNYEPLLKVITDMVKKSSSLFQATPTTLTIAADALALDTVRTFHDSSTKPLFENTFGTRVASVNFADVTTRKTFRTQIEQLREQLITKLNDELSSATSGMTIQNYVASLITPLNAFKPAPSITSGNGTSSSPRATTDNTRSMLRRGLFYAFERQHLREQRLHLRAREKGQHPRLKGHKVTISIKNLRDFDTQLVNDISRHVIDMCSDASSEELENTRAVLEQRIHDPASDLGKLKTIMSQQSLGRLQKEAKLRYLDFLYDGIRRGKDKEDTSLKLLHTMIQRLRQLDAYFNDPNKEDRYYTVHYAGVTVNYRDLFARADAFDMLPIISEIEGSLGETSNKHDGEQHFISGIKLKLNGPVQAYHTASVFNYYLNLLDPQSKEHQERLTNSLYNKDRFVEKVLKIMLLYYFVLFRLDDEQYNPVERLELGALPKLQGNDEQEKQNILRSVKESLTRPFSAKTQQKSGKASVQEQISMVKKLLIDYLKNDTTGPTKREYPLHLELEHGILEQDPSSILLERKFFQDVLNTYGTEALKYLAIKDADASGSGFCTLPVSILFEPLYYFVDDEPVRSFDMEYALDGFDTLPVLFVPNQQQSEQICAQFYKDHKRLIFLYQPVLRFPSDDPRAFVYRFTFLLLSYICIKLLADSQPRSTPEQKKKLFLPLVRLHTVSNVEKNDISQEGSVLRSLSKVLAHMLAEEYASSAQGFALADLNSSFKRSNGLSSLYSVLPKKFSFTEPSSVPSRLPKLAAIVVSSRKTDWNSHVNDYGATIFGEVIGMERQADGSICIEPLTTFSHQQTSDTLYTVPTAVSDEIMKCYEHGYQHFLYIAKAPYSSTLHITNAQDSEELFFMSKEIIQKLMQLKDDIRIYPLFCDKYYVINLHSGSAGTPPPSLYVDDTRELTSLVTDPNQSSVVFFNLFNGVTVGRDQKVYNGVISYATLVNMYDNITYDRAIRTDLLDGTQAGSCKREILEYLTLLHFSRYEKEKAISFKLEPYRAIIGDDSVGSLAQFPHIMSVVRFNALAFLTAVRGVLNIQQGLSSAPRHS